MRLGNVKERVRKKVLSVFHLSRMTLHGHICHAARPVSYPSVQLRGLQGATSMGLHSLLADDLGTSYS